MLYNYNEFTTKTLDTLTDGTQFNIIALFNSSGRGKATILCEWYFNGFNVLWWYYGSVFPIKSYKKVVIFHKGTNKVEFGPFSDSKGIGEYKVCIYVVEPDGSVNEVYSHYITYKSTVVPEIKFSGVSFVDNNTGSEGKKITANSWDSIMAEIFITSNRRANIKLKIEWVHDLSFRPDKVVESKVVSGTVLKGLNEVKIGSLTDTDGKGGYFVRVYLYENGHWTRIDPWTSWWNPGRPEVTFK